MVLWVVMLCNSREVDVSEELVASMFRVEE
jgi:hypothetical protein